VIINFHIGEKVVYPNYGVGTIENIRTRAFGAQFEPFYLLRLAYRSMTVMVPFSHVGDLGLRRVTKSAEVNRVLNFLAEVKCKTCPDWKNRFRENSERMRVGTLTEVAEVFKTLLILNKEKPLSFREKKMLDRARQLLISEVAIARSLAEPDAVDLLTRTVAKSALKFPEPM